MTVLKCKMCGGDIQAEEGKRYGTCDHCGGTMTLPNAADERRANLFNRANHFRRQNEFDKALAAYENILDEDNSDAEAHWGAVLCRYGIEYVEDPATHERVPTCRRARYESVLSDADYLAALEHAPDDYTHGLYEKEARTVSEIQKGILAISQKEAPFDVFICYKEATDAGTRTKDSVLAQDIYHQLTQAGHKAFFSRVTLEDKLGREYEPYIFAALNSAKVMLVVGTMPEHFGAVWVKNEWSRYLTLMKKDQSRLLIPCYRDMDPYDLPEELSSLQSQDMGKIGFMQDLIRGVEKVLNAKPEEKAPPAVSVAAPGVASLFKRGTLLLEDGEWKQADEYFNRVLDIDPEYAPAYAGKLCAELKVHTEQGLGDNAASISEMPNYKNALRFADADYRAKLEEYGQRSNIKRQEKLSFLQVMRKERSFSIAAGENHTVGLRSDGVVAAGDNNYDQCKVSDWRDIVAVSAGRSCTVGLRADGTVGAVGAINYIHRRVSDWRDIVAISAGYSHTVGLCANGRVVSVEHTRQGHQYDASDWRNIVAVSAGGRNPIVGLHSDGTVVGVWGHSTGQRKGSDWRDIVAVSAGAIHTVGLRTDGTVVAVGDNNYGKCKVSDWRNIVAVSTGESHTVGLQADGTVVAVGDNLYGQCNVSDWKDIGVGLDKMHKAQEQSREWANQGLCPHCGGRFVNAGFFGLLGKKCESCGRPF